MLFCSYQQAKHEERREFQYPQERGNCDAASQKCESPADDWTVFHELPKLREILSCEYANADNEPDDYAHDQRNENFYHTSLTEELRREPTLLLPPRATVRRGYPAEVYRLPSNILLHSAFILSQF